MKIVQKNPEQQVMEIRNTGIGAYSTGGMVSGMALNLKGKIETGQIKNWELQFDSFQEVVDLISQLQEIRPFASQVNDEARALNKELS